MAYISFCSRRLQPARPRWGESNTPTKTRTLKGAATTWFDHHSPSYLDLASVALLLLLTIVFVWPVAGLGYLPNSTDFILQYYPNLAFLGHNLKVGEIPLWNPFLFAGTPYLADPQSQLLYLPDWPFLILLDTATAARAILLTHFALAAVGMYAYLRTIQLPRRAAFLGAAVYGLGPYAIQLVAWAPMLMSLAWMPWALLFAERSLQRRSLSYAGLAGAVLALQFFNGWPHGSYITAFLLLATFLRHLASELTTVRDWKPVLTTGAVGAAVGGSALAFSSPLWLPFLEYWSRSTYITDQGLAAAGQGNVTVLALLGVGGTEGHGAYLGATALVLAILGAIYGRDRSRAWMFIALAAFGLLVAFGSKAPLYGFLYQWVPGFKTFHMPGRFMVLFAFSASVLGAMGAQALFKLSGRRTALTVASAALLLLVPLVYTLVKMLGIDAPTLLLGNLLHPENGPYLNPAMASQVAVSGVVAVAFLVALSTNRLPRTATFYLAAVIVLGDILLFQGKDAHYFGPPPPISRWASPKSTIERLANEDMPFRVAGFQQNGTIDFMSDFPFNLNAGLVPPNFSMMYGLEDLQGYLPLQLRRYADYVAAINGGPQDYHWAMIYNFQSPLLDLLNLGYVMVRNNAARLQNVTVATNLDFSDPRKPVAIHPHPLLATSLQIDSYLGNAVDLEDGHVVARVRVTDSSGQTHSFELRAGIETAEWAYDRPDVLARVRHHRAPIASTRDLPSPTHVYAANLVFPHPITISGITIQQVEPSVHLAVPEVIEVPAKPVDRYEKVGEIDGATLYQNKMALPRALLVQGAEVATSPEEALLKLQSPDFDPRREVVLEGAGAPAARTTGTADVGQVRIVASGNNKVQLAVHATSSGFLLLNEISYPGWNAYLDGKQVRVWRANYLFRAIEVSPGEHDVEFRFEPDSLKLGLALSLSTLVILLTAMAVLRFKSQQQRKESTPR